MQKLPEKKDNTKSPLRWFQKLFKRIEKTQKKQVICSK